MGVRKLLTSVAMAAAFFAAASPSQAATNQSTLFGAPRGLISNDDALRQQTLDELQGLGVKWLRVVLHWRSVAPSSAPRRRRPVSTRAGRRATTGTPTTT